MGACGDRSGQQSVSESICGSGGDKMKRKLVFATGNEGKMREIREILKELDMEIYSLKEAGIESDAEENGTTFEENRCTNSITIMHSKSLNIKN